MIAPSTPTLHSEAYIKKHKHCFPKIGRNTLLNRQKLIICLIFFLIDTTVTFQLSLVCNSQIESHTHRHQTFQLSRLHRVSYRFTPFSQSHSRFFISHGFTNFEWIFSKTQFSKKNKHRQHILLKKAFLVWLTKIKQATLSWALLSMRLVKTHIDSPFQWKSLSDLLKIVEVFTIEYSRQHSSK